MDKETYLVIGLGNPGTQYARTRHNAGFETLEELSRRWHVDVSRKKFSGLIAETTYDGKRVVLCQPQTYMNLSGECVRQLLDWYKCPSNHLIVIYDDIDLPLGKLRLRKDGSAGTHNGMRSIIGLLGRQDFPRLRVGVGKKPEGWELANWVLSHYATEEDRKVQFDAFLLAADTVMDWIKNGWDSAMRTANAPKK